jgi:hypothetical protein
MCGDLLCPGCWEPYTGSDATLAPWGHSCSEGEGWARHPEARLCCRYSGPCTAPASWQWLRSEAECRNELGPSCTPGERKGQPREHCDAICSKFGMWQQGECRRTRIWATMLFLPKSATLAGQFQRQLDNLVGQMRAYRIPRLTLEAYALPSEGKNAAEAKGWARKRAQFVKSALLQAGVSASIEIEALRFCDIDPNCTAVVATTDKLTTEQLEAGHGHSLRWKSCEDDVTIGTRLSIAGDEGDITFELCRNGSCSRTTENARGLAQSPSSVSFELRGPLPASLSMRPTLEQIENNKKYPLPWLGRAEYRAELHDHSNAARLSQGDRYRFALYRTNRTDPYQLLEWTAGYTETFLNGPENDPVPCRRTSVEAELRAR